MENVVRMLKCQTKNSINLSSRWEVFWLMLSFSDILLPFCVVSVHDSNCDTRWRCRGAHRGIRRGRWTTSIWPKIHQREYIWIVSSISLMLSRRYLLIGSNFCYQKKCLKCTKKDFHLPCRINFSASSSFRSPRLRYCIPDGAEGIGPGDDIASGSIPSSSRVVAASTATWTTAGAWVGTTFGVQSPARTKGAVCQRFNMDEFCKNMVFFLVRRKFKK